MKQYQIETGRTRDGRLRVMFVEYFQKQDKGQPKRNVIFQLWATTGMPVFDWGMMFTKSGIVPVDALMYNDRSS